jgi:hypothetical protein
MPPTPVLDFASGGNELELRVTSLGGGPGAKAAISMSALDVKTADSTR